MPVAVFEYTVIRVVPRVERGECINVGIALFCKAHRFLEARIALDEDRLLALDPSVDIPALIERLDAIVAVCAGAPEAGDLGRMEQAERFRWVASPRSTIVQPSAVHTGECEDPADELAHLMTSIVAPL